MIPSGGNVALVDAFGGRGQNQSSCDARGTVLKYKKRLLPVLNQYFAYMIDREWLSYVNKSRYD